MFNNRTATTIKILAHIVTILAFVVVVLGAYTRLKDAGLGCPDWPGCYGNLIVAIDSSKAGIEMIHRYIAGSLGLLILFMAWKSIPIRLQIPGPAKLILAIAILVLLQAALGMFTVTLKLYPVIVTAHFLGGMLILSMLRWFTLSLQPINLHISSMPILQQRKFKFLSFLTVLMLSIQLLLGAWTSSNYAALVCGDFPSCQGQWWSQMDWSHAFNFTAVGVADSPGIQLENAALVTIQMTHRIGALIASCFILLLGIKLLASHKSHKLRQTGLLLLGLLCLQLILGIANVLTGLQLTIALLHNATAALLLLVIIDINFALRIKKISYGL